jgi:hypothetical protein
MARGRATHDSRRHQQTPLLPCPCCQKRFADVLRHLNHRNSKCRNWFTLLPYSTQIPPSQPLDFVDDRPSSPPTGEPEPSSMHNSSQPSRTVFPNASKIYGQAKSFMDRFNDDIYASHRVQNPYYPFADKEEWELGSFLLRSGMSMQKVDEFLRLKLVCRLGYSFTSFTDLC